MIRQPAERESCLEEDRMKCPKCGNSNIRKSRAKTYVDRLVHYVGMVRYRCMTCDARFRRYHRGHFSISPRYKMVTLMLSMMALFLLIILFWVNGGSSWISSPTFQKKPTPARPI